LTKQVAWLLTVSIAILILAFLPMLAGFARQDEFQLRVLGASIERKTRSLAGRGVVDCGTVKPGSDPGKATLCGLAAHSREVPFRVVYMLQGIDSTVADAFVQSPEGRLFRIAYDSCPQGCGFSLWHQRTYTVPCAKPQVLTIDPHGHLTCPIGSPDDGGVAEYGPLAIY
jgi:hypothetical protein